MSAIPLRKTVHYPDSDGLPMADNDPQYRVMTDLRHALENRYDEAPDVYVGANLFIYYREGDPGARVAPDVFVAFGVDKEERRSYRVWEEGRVPALAFEIASPEGWRGLLDKKKGLYEQLGVEEYVVFDPDGEFIQPRLQGFRLENGRYRPLPLEPGGSLVSRTTGLRILPEEKNLRLIDLVTGERYLWAKESAAEAREAKAAKALAERETAARRAAEEELARLRAEIERLKASG
ncbi:MAG TPA: Uma2 family endonuclease [Thermoanaerobaculia bacterium]|nr:Uma2 family endonuclease [Thermoanaerobaculia bacterium]